MKVLSVDIETRPNLVYTWGLYDQNIGINQIVEPVEMLCWAAKWLGEGKTFFRSVFADGKQEMIQGIWDLLDEADVVMGYNSASFDVKHLYREFVLAGFDPPAPFRQIDLYSAVKKKFNFPSKKLEYVCQVLGLGEKSQHEGFDLWKRCMAKEASAWQVMKYYNINDVLLVERLYERILPWIASIPSRASFYGEHVCPACGSADLADQGHAYTQQSKFKRYKCRQCGKWSRDTHRVEGVTIREVSG